MSALTDALYLAWRALRASPGRSAVVVGGLAVAWFLPAFTWQVGQLAEGRLLARAHETPVVVGHVGNAFELTMSSLYFRGEVADPITFADLEVASPYGTAVPLHVGHTAGGAPVVGTTLDYLDQRGLALAYGRRPAVLGEVVVGAHVAAEALLAPGDTLRSDQKNLYNLAGAYPLQLQVVGVLAPTGGPDDEAIFADIKTAWVLDGRLHGHASVDGEEGEVVEASLAMFLFTEVSEATRGSFHLHGEATDWPVSSILVWPRDVAARDQLLGDGAVDARLQTLQPVGVVRTILAMVLRLQQLLAAWGVLVGVSTAAFIGLVVHLTLRLRADEVRLLRRMGAGRARVAAILGAEAGVLAAMSILVAAGLTAVATWGLVAALGL